MQNSSYLFTMLMSFVFGILHALEPGHGKSAMLAHFVSGKRSFWLPIVMGVSTALSHSVALLSVAFLMHLTHHFVTGDHHHEQQFTLVLEWFAASLLIVIGISMLISDLRGKPSCCRGGHCEHHAVATPSLVTLELPTSATKVTSQPEKSTADSWKHLRTTALIGIAIGLMPCPTAMAAFFAGVSSGDLSSAYLVIALFSLGIAISLAGIGYALQFFGEVIRNCMTSHSQIRWDLLRSTAILATGAFCLIRLLVSDCHDHHNG